MKTFLQNYEDNKITFMKQWKMQKVMQCIAVQVREREK